MENGASPVKCSRLDASTRKVTVILGAQWGDEGKGKIVDLLAENADVVCRCQGGNNAGHTVVVDQNEYDFHLLPSGIIHEKCKAVIGNGVVIHLPSLFQELEKNGITQKPNWHQRLIISDRAHLVFDIHQQVDGLNERAMSKSNEDIGTTKKGIGPTYSTKTWRSGLRLCDLLGDFADFEKGFKKLVASYRAQFPDVQVDVEAELQRYKEFSSKIKSLDLTRDTVSYLHKKLHESSAHSILVEGTYPYVTSSNCTVGGVLTGLGIAPRSIGEVYGVAKAYCTRVGGGVFPTELDNAVGQKLRDLGKEYGVTTGRPRRCGWLDMVSLRYSNMINGFTAMAVTKLDILDTFEEVKIGVAYKIDGQQIDYVPASTCELKKVQVEYITLPGWNTCSAHIRKFADLPANAQSFIRKFEELLGVPVKWVGVGKDRAAFIKVF